MGSTSGVMDEGTLASFLMTREQATAYTTGTMDEYTRAIGSITSNTDLEFTRCLKRISNLGFGKMGRERNGSRLKKCRTSKI